MRITVLGIGYAPLFFEEIVRTPGFRMFPGVIMDDLDRRKVYSINDTELSRHSKTRIKYLEHVFKIHDKRARCFVFIDFIDLGYVEEIKDMKNVYVLIPSTDDNALDIKKQLEEKGIPVGVFKTKRDHANIMQVLKEVTTQK